MMTWIHLATGFTGAWTLLFLIRAGLRKWPRHQTSEVDR